jgi:hypothetical protein
MEWIRKQRAVRIFEGALADSKDIICDLTATDAWIVFWM